MVSLDADVLQVPESGIFVRIIQRKAIRRKVMKRLFTGLFLAFSITMLSVSGAYSAGWEKYDKPVPTKVMVRVLAHGAKAMSPETGVVVVLRNAATNEILDKGDARGSTGDTTALMETGYARKTGQTGLLKGQKGALIKDSSGCEMYSSKMDTAVFVTTIKISKPTQIVIEAHGPLMPHNAGQTVLATTWLFPGEDIAGEGIVLELRGLIVDALASLKESEIDVNKAKNGISLPFYMQMMCGCPIAPRSGGLPWVAEDFKITVQAYYKGKLYHEEVTTADKLFVSVSAFKTNVPLPKGLPDGKFKREKVKVRVMAAQPKLANYGMDEFYVYLSR